MVDNDGECARNITWLGRGVQPQRELPLCLRIVDRVRGQTERRCSRRDLLW